MGTLFRIFPHTPTDEDSLPAEVVEISTPPEEIGPGPSDDRMYVISPVDKPKEYGMHEDDDGNPYVFLPPWDGPRYAPAVADEDGNFLQYDDINDPQFLAVHTYASIRYTLDVWENYYGRPIEWYFKDYYPQAEVVILPDFENAQIGRGFIEIGADVNKKTGVKTPFSLNFDVIAHEVGHGILFAEAGEPDVETETSEFLGFQESGGDIVSMIAVLSFDSVIDELLESTSGNLYMANHLNRFAETSSYDQIRMASNSYKLSDFEDGWKDSHILAQPLTGAVFDILVDIFQEELVRLGAISSGLEELSDALEGSPEYGEHLQEEFDIAYAANPGLFREALVYARDAVANLMIETWARLDTEYLSYLDIYWAMREADNDLFEGLYGNIIDVNFAWRDIGNAVVGPKLPKDKDDEGHSHSHDKEEDKDGNSDKHDNANGIHSAEVNQEDHSHSDESVTQNPDRRIPRRRSYAERYREARMVE